MRMMKTGNKFVGHSQRVLKNNQPPLEEAEWIGTEWMMHHRLVDGPNMERDAFQMYEKKIDAGFGPQKRPDDGRKVAQNFITIKFSYPPPQRTE